MSFVRMRRFSKTSCCILILSGYVLICQSLMGMDTSSENIIIPSTIIITLSGLALHHSRARFARALIDLSYGSSSPFLLMSNSYDAFSFSSDCWVPCELSNFLEPSKASAPSFYFLSDGPLPSCPASSSSLDFSSILLVLLVPSLAGLSYPNSICFASIGSMVCSKVWLPGLALLLARCLSLTALRSSVSSSVFFTCPSKP